jgi:hypothetical protein
MFTVKKPNEKYEDDNISYSLSSKESSHESPQAGIKH